MLDIKKLTPICLRHNPNWVYFFKTVDLVWTDNVASHIPNLSVSGTDDLTQATREDILLRASRFGWTFADNFSANWDDDDRAERFLKRFIESWIPYCRSYSGTLNLANYMGYLLGMEIRIVQLWCNEKDEWDTKPLPQLFRMEETILPENYLIKSGQQDPFYTTEIRPESSNLRSVSELNNKFQGWKTIDVDPDNGWYPTSYFDVYVDLDQVPKSDLQEKSAEEIIAGLFYELADICQVLRAVVYSYGFTQVVKIASGASIMNRMGNYTVPDVPLQQWGAWSVTDITADNLGSAHYEAFKTNGVMSYFSSADLDLTPALLRSFHDTDMQQWQAVKDAIGQLTGASSWTFDNADKVVRYVVASTGIQPYDQYIYQLPTIDGRNSADSACIDYLVSANATNTFEHAHVTVSSNYFTCFIRRKSNSEILENITGNILLNPNYDPSAVAPTQTITYQQVVDKIISNLQSSTQGVALLAQAYVDAVANSINDADESKRFVTLSDLESQFEANKVS